MWCSLPKNKTLNINFYNQFDYYKGGCYRED